MALFSFRLEQLLVADLHQDNLSGSTRHTADYHGLLGLQQLALQRMVQTLRKIKCSELSDVIKFVYGTMNCKTAFLAKFFFSLLLVSVETLELHNLLYATYYCTILSQLPKAKCMDDKHFMYQQNILESSDRSFLS